MKGVVAAAALVLPTAVGAQATDNLAPTITLPGISEGVRADTLCVEMQSGEVLDFTGLSVADSDVAAGDLRVRVELEPGGVGAPSVSIPGLGGLPGVTVTVEDPDRIRFAAPLTSVNLALDGLSYQSDDVAVDIVDIIADDQQVPALSAEFRLYLDIQASTTFAVEQCKPPPDLSAGSDTGASNSDDITAATSLSFEIAGLQPGDEVMLLNDEVLVDQGMAAGPDMTLVDSTPIIGQTGLYSVVVNGDLGSASWSVAVVTEPVLFSDGFESP